MLEPWAFVAIAIAIGLFGVLAIQMALIPQQAEAAGCENGIPNSARAFNASKGRCFGH